MTETENVGRVSSCPAVDYPVWMDGSQERIPCEEPAGHAGPHVGDQGDWSWNS